MSARRLACSLRVCPSTDLLCIGRSVFHHQAHHGDLIIRRENVFSVWHKTFLRLPRSMHSVQTLHGENLCVEMDDSLTISLQIDSKFIVRVGKNDENKD